MNRLLSWLPSPQAVARRVFIERVPLDGRSLALFGVVLLGALFYTWRRIPVVLDDAYITFKVAENLAAGHGMVFNPGVSLLVSTTPLWTGLLALMQVLAPGVPMPIMAVGLSLTAFAIASWFLFLLFRPRLGWVAALTPLAVCLNPLVPEAFGNEVALLFACVAFSFWAYAVRRSLLLACVGAGLAYVTRSDAGLLLAGLLGAHALIHREDRPRLFREAALGLGAFALIALAWHGYHYQAFGAIFPSTLGTKVAQGASGVWSTFAQALPTVAASTWRGQLLWLVFALVGGAAIFRHQPAFVIWIAVHLLAYAVLRPASYVWYYYPLFLGVALAVVFGIGGALRWALTRTATTVGGWERLASIGAGALVVVCLLSLFSFGQLQPLEAARLALRQPLTPADDGRFQAYRQAGLWLAQHAPAGSLVSTDEIGIVSYHAPRLPMVDPPGILVPRVTADRVSRTSLSPRAPQYARVHTFMLEHRPDYLILRGHPHPRNVAYTTSAGTVTYQRVFVADSPYWAGVYRREK